MLVVMSSSMEPTIETGAVVLMRHLDRSPRPGDIVEVDVPIEAREEYGYPAQVLHRVIAVTGDGLVRTKGDHLDDPDPFAVPKSEVHQALFAVVPGAGRLVAFLTSAYGLLWIGAGIVLFMVLPFLDGQRELRLAVSEYGYHLKSHTAIVKSMAAASRELAATAEQLRAALSEVSPAPGNLLALREPEAALRPRSDDEQAGRMLASPRNPTQPTTRLDADGSPLEHAATPLASSVRPRRKPRTEPRNRGSGARHRRRARRGRGRHRQMT
jgi:hypothetical protein